MSHVIQSSRLLPRCTACVMLRTSHNRQIATQPVLREHTRSSIPSYLVGSASALLTLYLGHKVAYAKAEDEEDEDEDEDEDDEEQAEMESNLDQHLDAEIEAMSQFEGGETRLEKWMKDQESYLLLDAQRRTNFQFRDSVTQQELAEVDELYEEKKMTELEDKLVELNTVVPNSPEVLWRLARLKWCTGKDYDSNHQHKVYQVALNLAIKAANIAPDNGNAHRWIVVLGAYVAEKGGIKASVLNLEGFKYHVDRALEINPDDHICWTLLGNWHFEIADFTYLNKLWCKLVVGDLPTGASYEKAIQCFKKSEEVSTESWSVNTLSIAKCYLRTGNVAEALVYLQELSRRTIVTVEDFRVRKEAHILIQKITHPNLKDKVIGAVTGTDGTRYRIPRATETKHSFPATSKYWGWA